MLRRLINMIRKINGYDELQKTLNVILRQQDYKDNSQIIQNQLTLYYKNLINNGKKLPGFRNAGFRVFSASNEDGIINYIFSIIGTYNKYCLDIAFASPFGSNTTNLIVNNNWTGLLICGEEKEAEQSMLFFNKNIDTAIYPPVVKHYWVDAENINVLLQKNDVPVEIDFFSLDMDGMDYWVWKNLTLVSPRVVVVEAAAFLGGDVAITVPYNARFSRHETHPDYFGASITAFIKLAKTKNYRLVACNHLGYNLFFVRNDIGLDHLPEIDIDECFRYETPHLKKIRKSRWENIKRYSWEEV